MTLITRAEAWGDIYTAAGWLDDLNAGAGDPFLDAVDRCAADLLQRPRQFQRVNRPPRGREVRYGLIPGGSNFVITYEVTAAQIVVWSVGHAKQRSQPWRRRMRP